MDIASKILSDVTVFMKYAKHIKSLRRRETYEEIVDRNKAMHLKKFPQLAEEIENAYTFVYAKKVLPSMRSMQFAGAPAEINNARGFNCCFLPIDHPDAFSEVMFLLLSGCGVGYSVQTHHVAQLPEIKKSTKTRRYLVGDNIIGWADAIKVLMYSYFYGKSVPVFDFRDIRPKGAPLIIAGGKAPGPEPLKKCLQEVQRILDRKKDGEQLTSLEVHDILCFISDAILSGGIRRAALISLFDIDDQDMLTSKFGAWYEDNPQRARANNSAVVIRHKITESVFKELWEKIKASGSGEPGLFFSNDKEQGTNPCAEVNLKKCQFCNLTEINGTGIPKQEELNARAKAAAFIGTLQASYTDFHYLRPIWKKTTDEEALIGVGITGIAAGDVLNLDLDEAATVVKKENERVAKLIGINKAARTTVVKPSGTTSLVLGTSSGIHAWHDDFYIRRLRVGKNESIYQYLSLYHPNLVEDEYFKPHIDAVISIPQRAPVGAITRSESALDLLSRVKHVWEKWIKVGHRKGSNTNNVSTTVTIKPDEWDDVGNWMWENRNSFTALSVLPHSDHTYIQAPYETITEEKFNELLSDLEDIDLTRVVEFDDTTDQAGEAACAGGACEL